MAEKVNESAVKAALKEQADQRAKAGKELEETRKAEAKAANQEPSK